MCYTHDRQYGTTRQFLQFYRIVPVIEQVNNVTVAETAYQILITIPPG